MRGAEGMQCSLMVNLDEGSLVCFVCFLVYDLLANNISYFIRLYSS